MRSPGDPDRDAERLLEARAARFRTPLERTRELFTTIVTFKRAQGSYGLSLTDLKEIRALTKICPLPGASRIVPGVVHYRGELLSLHDLAAFARSDSDKGHPASWVLVAEFETRRFGLMADDVLDIVDIEVQDVHPVPLTLGDFAEVVSGMTRDNVLLLDAPKLFQSHRFVSAF